MGAIKSEVAAIEPFFDKAYYLSMYADVAAAKCDPVSHYCEYGWREGRNPTSEFDTQFYLQSYSDVAAAGVNPFFHFVMHGRVEGRSPKRTVSSVRRVIASAKSAHELAATANVSLGEPRSLRADDVCEAVSASGYRKGIVFSASHDDYGASVGGVQNILSDECIELNQRGVGHLHLCPVRPIRSLSPATEPADFEFAVRLNGTALGRIDGRGLKDALRQLAQVGCKPYWVIHHLMGHSPEVIEQLVSTACEDVPLFWAHDFYAACTSYALMRNDVSFCHAPPLSSPACRVCVYGTERGEHAARVRSLIHRVQPRIVAPSHNALENWIRMTGITPARSAVVHPARLCLTRERRPARSGPLRIGFIGQLVFHKGWDVFERLAHDFHRDERYKFFQLGRGSLAMPGFIRNIPVQVSSTDRDAMLRAVARHEIDAVVCWSLWPETFNFTVHEAIAGGAFVIARREQGNVWPAAQAYAPQASKAVEDEAELHRYLQSGQIIRDVDLSPRYRGAALPSMGSAELLALNLEETAHA